MKVPDMPEEALAYSRLFDREGLENKMTWCGHKVQKLPSDMWVYQEIIAETRPDLILEVGSGAGGSGLFFACVLEAVRIPDAMVLSFDPVCKWKRPSHPFLYFVQDSPTQPECISRIRRLVKTTRRRLMVIEDGNHSYSLSSNCLELFSPLVGEGCYYVVEDTDRHRSEGNDVWRTVCEFLKTHPAWEQDWSRHKFHHTTCYGGFLKRRQ